MNLTLKIYRQDGPNQPGRMETYNMTDISEHMSFLEMMDVLNEQLVADGQEPVAFDHDCREGICGMCSMYINGEAHGPDRGVTTCQLHMRKFKDGDTIYIEPWRAKAFPVVKDLVVDRSAFDRIMNVGGFVSVNTSGNTQDFPTSYKCDFNDCGDNYLDWTYYLMNGDMATMMGYGAFNESTLTLSHAPSNFFYGYQVGVAANNANGNYGSGGWFYYEGSLVFDGASPEDVSGAGDFAFDHDCCPDYYIERTWCVSDCSGNETCYTQTITFEDLDGEGPETPGVVWPAIQPVKGDFDITTVKPNPAVDMTTVEFMSNTFNTLTLEVYDLSGRKVATLFSGNVDKGVQYRTDFNTAALESGIYNVRRFSLSHQVNEKLVVSK